MDLFEILTEFWEISKKENDFANEILSVLNTLKTIILPIKNIYDMFLSSLEYI